MSKMKRTTFRCDRGASPLSPSEDELADGCRELDWAGKTWKAYEAAGFSSPIEWLVGRYRSAYDESNPDGVLLRTLGAAWVFDHCEYLEAPTERLLVSHLNIATLSDKQTDALAAACVNWDLVWKQTRPSWTGRPLMIELRKRQR